MLEFSFSVLVPENKIWPENSSPKIGYAAVTLADSGRGGGGAFEPFSPPAVSEINEISLISSQEKNSCEIVKANGRPLLARAGRGHKNLITYCQYDFDRKCVVYRTHLPLLSSEARRSFNFELELLINQLTGLPTGTYKWASPSPASPDLPGCS